MCKSVRVVQRLDFTYAMSMSVADGMSSATSTGPPGSVPTFSHIYAVPRNVSDPPRQQDLDSPES